MRAMIGDKSTSLSINRVIIAALFYHTSHVTPKYCFIPPLQQAVLLILHCDRHEADWPTTAVKARFL
jgi:hypothetical protein